MITLENLLGYVFVVLWGISFYPPIYINYHLQDCPGISTDSIIINEIGYISFVQSTFLQYFTTSNSKLTVSDLVCSAHGLSLNLVLGSQVVFGKYWPWRFPNYTRKKMKYFYYKVAQISILFWLVCTVVYFVRLRGSSTYTLVTTSYCNMLYLIKIALSLLKYVPQFLHNQERQSMNGFPIFSAYCDAFGGFASLWQLLLLSKYTESRPFHTHNEKYMFFTKKFMIDNFGKLGNTLVTTLFQIAFITQYFMYYKKDHIKIVDQNDFEMERRVEKPRRLRAVSKLETIAEMA